MCLADSLATLARPTRSLRLLAGACRLRCRRRTAPSRSLGPPAVPSLSRSMHRLRVRLAPPSLDCALGAPLSGVGRRFAPSRLSPPLGRSCSLRSPAAPSGLPASLPARRLARRVPPGRRASRSAASVQAVSLSLAVPRRARRAPFLRATPGSLARSAHRQVRFVARHACRFLRLRRPRAFVNLPPFRLRAGRPVPGLGRLGPPLALAPSAPVGKSPSLPCLARSVRCGRPERAPAVPFFLHIPERLRA